MFLLGLTNTWPAAALRNDTAPLGGFLQRALQLREPEGQQQQPKKDTNKQNMAIIFRGFNNYHVLKHIKLLTFGQLTAHQNLIYVICSRSLFQYEMFNIIFRTHATQIAGG